MRRKNALTLLLLTMLAVGILSFQWVRRSRATSVATPRLTPPPLQFFWGYSLTFSDTGGPFLGDLKHFGLMGVLEKP